MEAAAPAPQRANPAPAPAKKALAAASAAKRKTLCDITNLNSQRCAAASVDGVGDVAQFLKENSDLVRLLGERDQIIQLSGAELQKLRVANWQLAQANSQMLAEVNLGRHKLKALQHELACSKAALKAKTSELEEAKRLAKQNKHLQEKATNDMFKDGTTNPEHNSDAPHAASAKKACNASRKRMLRSRSLGPGASTKLVASKEKDARRRKSLRTPEPSSERDDLFEIEDVQLAISVNKVNPHSVSGAAKKETSHDDTVQFPQRTSLGRPLRRAAERVSSYKEMPVNIKLRRS